MSSRKMTARELSQLRKVRELQGEYLMRVSLAEKALEERDREIRRLLKDGRFSQVEIAAACGLSRERVRQTGAKSP